MLKKFMTHLQRRLRSSAVPDTRRLNIFTVARRETSRCNWGLSICERSEILKLISAERIRQLAERERERREERKWSRNICALSDIISRGRRDIKCSVLKQEASRR